MFMKIFNNMGNAWVALLKVNQHAKSWIWHFYNSIIIAYNNYEMPNN